MEALKARLVTLNKNLNILLEREAKYGGNAPLELVNQIDDHHAAIGLVEAAIAGELTEKELEEELAPLNLALGPGPQINMGDVEGSFLAIGNGARLIVNQALSAVEEAKKQRDNEQLLLAEAVINLGTRLQQVVTRKPKTDGRSNPYKALLDYRLEDAALFYGRSQAIEQMLGRLDRNPLTVLHAESGAGKSSLLQAGLASRLLILGDLPLHIRPWNVNPALAIKRAILPNLEETPGLAGASLLDFLHKVTHILGPDRTLYIFLDQFEEFFTQLSQDSQQAFVGQLAACLEDESLRVRWVLAMRKEYFGNLATFRPQIKNPFANDYLLRAMTHAEAREVIVEPAKKQGVAYEPALVERLLVDLGTNSDGAKGEVAPPHIQLVCSTLFDKLLDSPDASSFITMAMYQEEGSAQGILRGHLNRVLQRTLSDKEREIARQLLVALVSSDQRRIRRTREDLAATLALYLSGAQSLDDILEQLVEHRLLKIQEDEETNAAAYELAHDYLLTEIEVDPEVQAQKAAAELLDRELESYRRYGSLLSADKYDIIRSQQAYLALNEEAKKLMRLSRAARTRRLRQIGALAVIIILVLSFLTWRALVRRNQAEAANRVAQARQLAAEAENLVNTNAELSLLLALEAVDQAKMVETENTLRKVLPYVRPWYGLETHSDEVLAAVWAPDGEQVALGLENGDIQLWDAATHTLVRTLSGHNDPVYGLQFNASGTHLVSSSRVRGAETETDIRLWDVASGRTVELLAGHKAGVFDLAWSPDGTRLLSAGEDGTIIVWDVTRLRLLETLTAHSAQVISVAWHPAGDRFASTGENGEAFIWDAATLEVAIELSGHHGFVLDAAWQPQGNRLATAGSDQTIRLWAAEDGHIEDILVGHDSWVRSVAWHPEGEQLASSSDDTRIIIWDVEAGRPTNTLTGHADWVQAVAWNPAGTHLVSASNDGTARIWSIQEIPSLAVLAGHVGETKTVAWHPGGELLASGGDDQTVRLWQPNTGQTVAVLAGHGALIYNVAWSPNGTRLASASADETVRIWNTVTIETTQVLTGHNDEVYAVAWSPDGQTLASGSTDQTIKLWEANTGLLKMTLAGHERTVLSLDFSPDGKLLASGSSDNTVVIWDAVTGEQLKRFDEHTNLVWDVAFSADGRYLASASQDATVRIWEVASGRTVATLPHQKPVNSVAWSADGAQLATASDDKQARLWEVERQAEIASLPGHQGGVWAVAWRPPQDSHLATAATDGLIRVFLPDFQEVLSLAQSQRHRELADWELLQFIGMPISSVPPP